MNIAEMIEVLQAAKAGKKIQENVDGEWLVANIHERVSCMTLRVAPEPREFWVNEFDGNLETLTQYLGNPDHKEVTRRVRFVEDMKQ